MFVNYHDTHKHKHKTPKREANKARVPSGATDETVVNYKCPA